MSEQLTPAQSPTGTDPSSPNQRRPANRETIQVAARGHCAMNVEDLSQGFYNISQSNEQEKVFTQGIHTAVDASAIILQQMFERVHGLEQVL